MIALSLASSDGHCLGVLSRRESRRHRGSVLMINLSTEATGARDWDLMKYKAERATI